uniref:major histocompatibility complex class I UFA precursor n=1 Tax=Danio rerio TaxID=7955 RepID=UPI000008A411|nr:major histocompatibility complex class I UFA precursor [Danio rerio]AAD41071.1 MHC class I protein [Danio rerio]
MRQLVLLLLGVHLAYAGKHSHTVIYTATKGLPDFPEFVAATMVDGMQVNYFDSEIKEVIPRQEWVRGAVDEQFWQRNTQIRSNMHQLFKNNINIAMERFNQTQGVHTFQFMVGCELEDDGTTRGHWQYGYDGEDFISFDKNTLTNVVANPQAVITKNKWDANKAQNEYRKQYLENQCIEWLRKYVGYGKDSLGRKDAPEVFMLQKDPSSPIVCQATGFYPSNIMMTWQKNKEEHFEDVDVGATLTNADGTFQKTVTLSVKPEEWKNNKEAYRCVVQHVGAKDDVIVTVKDIRSNGGSDNTIALLWAVWHCAVAVLLSSLGLFTGRSPMAMGEQAPKTLILNSQIHQLFR